jgi:hypoxanthine phosphoribosyltransferase
LTERLHIDPDAFLLDTFRLGARVYETGFRPRHVISIWRGGTPVGLGVDGYFRTRGIFLNHTTIATESYVGVQQQGDVTVKGLEHLIDVVCPEDGLLIVDDVLESGRTILRVLEILRTRARANAPTDVRVATVHRKPESVELTGVPVICLHDLPSEVWIDYPHELSDLVDPEDPADGGIREKDEEIWRLLSGVRPEPDRLEIEAPAHVLSARRLLLDAIRLGLMVVHDATFRPDFLVALWPGGVNAGLPVHEVCKWAVKKGLAAAAPDHISLNTTTTRSSYRSDVIGIHYLVEHIQKDDNLLIVDTTFRSGQLVNQVLMRLKEALRRNLTLENVRVAAVYHNPHDTSTWTVPRAVNRPDYYVHEVDREVIYPQSVPKLTHPEAELAALNPGLRDLLFGEG